MSIRAELRSKGCKLPPLPLLKMVRIFYQLDCILLKRFVGVESKDHFMRPFDMTYILHLLHSFFFIRTLCFWWGSNFLKLSPFKPYFFLFFFLISCVLRLNFLKFFLKFFQIRALNFLKTYTKKLALIFLKPTLKNSGLIYLGT